MPQLKDVVQLYVQKGLEESLPVNLFTGTVTAVDPLEIVVDSTMQPLKAAVLHLTAAVLEKKIPVLAHEHYINVLSHTHVTPTGPTDPALTGKYMTLSSLLSEGADLSVQGENIVCYENGEALPIQDGYIILNRALEEGDKVLLLRVRSGQEFIVLSRVFKGGAD